MLLRLRGGPQLLCSGRNSGEIHVGGLVVFVRRPMQCRDPFLAMEENVDAGDGSDLRR